MQRKVYRALRDNNPSRTTILCKHFVPECTGGQGQHRGAGTALALVWAFPRMKVLRKVWYPGCSLCLPYARREVAVALRAARTITSAWGQGNTGDALVVTPGLVL